MSTGSDKLDRSFLVRFWILFFSCSVSHSSSSLLSFRSVHQCFFLSPLPLELALVSYDASTSPSHNDSGRGKSAILLPRCNVG